ncbi:GAF/FHA/SpoE domain protein [Candidatus Sulfotelmatobacter kueseliae]|uniref:GAF/FHA/SpoE domain protein n=1 Tax=Candidatus Sulfotelmatobacter kueseliae TaxID=2042962 RepID=A0A2U3K2C5_9BACT|nr:GAF/FHA/SpoE domain protein [Candidatus Sulfotelmatobacter kueseliae]
MALNSISQRSSSGVFPALVFVQGSEQKNIVLNHIPFTVGRKVDKDLVIADPRVSRDHAQILQEGVDFVLEDLGSKHGTFVNGERVQRQKLERGDRLEFGARDSAYVLFNPAHATSNTAREFLSQISGIQIKQETTDLEKLTLFLEAARKLNTVGVLDEILMTMLDVTLQLTRAERGYVFLKDEEGKLRLAAGRNAKKEPLLDDTTISHSILEDSLRSNSEFVLTDTSRSSELAGRRSIVAYDLRTVVCIPLRKMQVQATRDAQATGSSAEAAAMGVLYVDSRFASRDMSGVDQKILHVIATEAASLIENARLVQAEEESRRYQQELSIAASIQQRLMQVKIPEVPFAQLRGKNLSCKEIGGDFFDAVNTKEGLAVVLADVSGKGVSAALLASTLQGMIYSHLTAGSSLLEVVTAVNRFFTEKMGGEKYATVLLARLRRDGELEYVNCGHVPPLLVCGAEVLRPPHGNVPVGLLPDATFESATCQMKSGDRFILVTDGVTEAENAMGEFFDDPRLEAAAAKSPTLEGIFSAVTEFCAGNPLNDDCTVVELRYASAEE